MTARRGVLRKNEKINLRKTDRAMVRAIRDQKVIDKKTTEKQMDMWDLRKL